MWTTYPAFATPFVRRAVDFFRPWHVAQALPTPVGRVLRLIDACYIFGDCGFSKGIEPLEDALIGEVQPAVAMATVLLHRLFEGTFLGDVSLFVAIVAEAVAASASKEGMLNWSPTPWGQWHPIFGHCAHRGVGDVRISDLLQCLYLFHPPLYSIHLHVNREESA